MNDAQKKLLNEFQRDVPLTARPYQVMGERLGISEDEVIKTLAELGASGVLSRVGAVIRPNTVGQSTLAAMSVPADKLEAVAALISDFDEVNHNYEREHRLNLWFVIAARSVPEIDQVIAEIEQMTGIKVLNLPMLDDYHLDLGFDLKWN